MKMNNIYPKWRSIQALAYVMLLLASPAISQEHRMALVMGNANYEHLPHLKNPVNDAIAISDTLASLGFTVYLMTNTKNNELRSALEVFALKSKDADVVAVYYAGHSASIRGENLLFSTDFDPSASSTQTGFLGLQEIQETFAGRDHLNLIFFDACSEPLLLKGAQENVQFDLLAPPPPPINTLVSYAATVGAAAYDGISNHSIFTGALLDNLRQPDIDIEVMLRSVRRDVIVNSQGKQIPQTLSALVSDFYLFPTSTNFLTQMLPNTDIKQSLTHSGFSQKPILSEIQSGLVTPNQDANSRDKRSLLIAKLCAAIEGPLPKLCLEAQ